MLIECAVIKEPGRVFSIVVVKPMVLRNATMAAQVRASMSGVFPAPILLMAWDEQGAATFSGRADLVRRMESIDPRSIPWERYTIP